jgi:hypothetical protein
MKRNYPFGTFPEWVLDAEVSDRAFRVWCCLDRYRRGADSIEVKQQEIADRLHCSLSSVERAIRELRAIHAIDVVSNVDGLRGQRESTYFLWPCGDVSCDGAVTSPVTDPATSPVTDSATSPVTDPSSLLESKRDREKSPARSQANGAPLKGIHPVGERLLREAHDSRPRPRPLIPNGSWPTLTRTIGALIDEGHDPARIREALMTVPTYSTGTLNIALAKLAPKQPVFTGFDSLPDDNNEGGGRNVQA